MKILKLFDQAAERGVKVDFDLYPYLTGSTQLVTSSSPTVSGGRYRCNLRKAGRSVLQERDYEDTEAAFRYF